MRSSLPWPRPSTLSTPTSCPCRWCSSRSIASCGRSTAPKWRSWTACPRSGAAWGGVGWGGWGGWGGCLRLLPTAATLCPAHRHRPLHTAATTCPAHRHRLLPTAAALCSAHCRRPVPSITPLPTAAAFCPPPAPPRPITPSTPCKPLPGCASQSWTGLSAGAGPCGSMRACRRSCWLMMAAWPASA